MRKFIKNNMTVIIGFTILFIFSLILCVRNVVSENIKKDDSKRELIFCAYILKYETDNEMYDICSENIKATSYKRTVLKTFNDIINNDTVFNNSYNLSTIYYFFIPFVVMASSLYNISKRFKNLEIKNALTRESYNSYIKKTMLNSYKSIIIWPLITIFLFAFSYIISGGSFEIIDNSAIFTEQILNNPVLFMISYLLNTIFISVFWVSICMLIVSDTRNYLVSVIESVMIYFGLNFVNTFFFIPFVFKRITSNPERYFDFLDVYTYNNKDLLPFNILCFVLALIGVVLVYLKYKNKEKIFVKLERNQ